jgi:integrase
MHIYKREGSANYYCRFRVARREFRLSLDTTSKSVAKERAELKRDQKIRELKYGEVPARTLETVIDEYEKEYMPTLKPRTRSMYASALIRWLTFSPNLEIGKIGKHTLYEYQAKRLAEKTVRTKGSPSGSTIRGDMRALSSVLSFCADKNYIESNPLIGALGRKRKGGIVKDNPDRTRWLRHGEEARLLAVCTDELLWAVTLSLDTGLRKEELFSLRWELIDWPRNEIMIPHDHPGNKAGVERRIPLLPRSRALLEQMPRRSRYVLAPKQDGRMGGEVERFAQLRRRFEAARTAAGLTDIIWHDLRRTCGCRLLQDHKLSMDEVAKWLGHQSPEVTRRVYAFLTVEQLHEAVEKSRDRAHVSR